MWMNHRLPGYDQSALYKPSHLASVRQTEATDAATVRTF